MTESTNNINALPVSKSEDPEFPPTPAKKPFVEPEVSSPVDVLEATTFFVAVDSGTVNP